MNTEKDKNSSSMSESDRVITQNVRVGDRVGVRYTGVGATYNLGEELAKSEKLKDSVGPTFDAVFLIFEKNQNGTKFFHWRRFLPDGSAVYLVDNGREVFKMMGNIASTEENPVKLEILEEHTNAEIIVISRFNSMDPGLITDPKLRFGIDKEFEEKLKRAV